MMKPQMTFNAPRLYEIRVFGHVGGNWSARFEGLTMQHQPEGVTILSGLLDQAALHGVMVKIRNLGLNLISVNPVEINDFTQ